MLNTVHFIYSILMVTIFHFVELVYKQNIFSETKVTCIDLKFYVVAYILFRFRLK